MTTDDTETNEQLLRRHKTVKAKYQQAKKSAERCKSRGNRERKMRFAGSLNFTLLQIESELDDRGLTYE